MLVGLAVHCLLAENTGQLMFQQSHQMHAPLMRSQRAAKGLAIQGNATQFRTAFSSVWGGKAISKSRKALGHGGLRVNPSLCQNRGFWAFSHWAIAV